MALRWTSVWKIKTCVHILADLLQLWMVFVDNYLKMYEVVNITAVFTWISGDLERKVIPHPHPIPHYLFCSWWGEVHGKEVHFWCNFVFKARAVELYGIAPIAKLPKERFNSVFKPGTASCGPYFAEFLETLEKSLLCTTRSCLPKLSVSYLSVWNCCCWHTFYLFLLQICTKYYIFFR